MGNYSLGDEALQDLDRLYEYGLVNFGLQKADAYYDNLLSRLDLFAHSPLQYPAVEHIRKGYRLSVYAKNSIYYRVSDDGEVLVVRILGRQSLLSSSE